MLAPALPANEAERLADLHALELLDARAELAATQRRLRRELADASAMTR